MTPRFLPLLVVAMLLAIASCGESPMRRTLRQAEAVMEVHPDSAYSRLTGLEVDSTASEEDRALHALLLVQAMHKTYKIWRDSMVYHSLADSLIRIATGYYEKHRNDTLLMKAYYYQGEIDVLRDKDFIQSLEPYSRSLDLALGRGDNFWTARNYNAIAKVYYLGGAFGDEVEAQRKSLEYYRMTGREEYILYAVSEYATALQNAHRYGEALKMEQELLSEFDEQEYPGLWEEITDLMVRTHFFLQDYGECIKDVERLEEAGMKRTELELFRILSYIYLGDFGSAQGYLDTYGDSLTSEERAMISNAFAYSKEDENEQLRSLREIYDALAQDYVRYTAMGFNSMQMHLARSAEERHKEAEKAERRRHVIVVGCMALMGVLVIMGCIRLLRRMRRKKMHVEHQLRKIEGEKDTLHCDLEEEKHRLALLRKRYDELDEEMTATLQRLGDARELEEELSRRLDTLMSDMRDIENERERLDRHVDEIKADKEKMELKLRKRLDTNRETSEREIRVLRKRAEYIADEYLESSRVLVKELIYLRTVGGPDAEEINRKILKAIDEYIATFEIDHPALAELEKKVNRVTGNLMRQLRRDMPGLSEEYYRICLYYLLGLDAGSMAYLSHKKSSKDIYNIIGRFREKLRELPEEKQAVYRRLQSGKKGKGKGNAPTEVSDRP